MTTYGISRLPWPARTPQHRWYGLGRYYAMFPAPFVTSAVEEFTGRGDVVMDPFSGRGNAPFLAAAMERPSVAVDILPVAWLFTTAKLKPSQDADRVLARLREMGRAVRPQDRKSRSKFETMAWAPAVRGFLRAARRELDWEETRTDRTLIVNGHHRLTHARQRPQRPVQPALPNRGTLAVICRALVDQARASPPTPNRPSGLSHRPDPVEIRVWGPGSRLFLHQLRRCQK